MKSNAKNKQTSPKRNKQQPPHLLPPSRDYYFSNTQVTPSTPSSTSSNSPISSPSVISPVASSTFDPFDIPLSHISIDDVFSNTRGPVFSRQTPPFSPSNNRSLDSSPLTSPKSFGNDVLDVNSSLALAEACSTAEAAASFVLLPGTKNAKPGLKFQEMDEESNKIENIPCRFGAECTRRDCRYFHAKKPAWFFQNPCRYGKDCRRKDCRFLHDASTPAGAGLHKSQVQPPVTTSDEPSYE